MILRSFSTNRLQWASCCQTIQCHLHCRSPLCCSVFRCIHKIA